jgi:hypothetical protein
MAVYGDGLSFEAEAQKRPYATQPVFKIPHARLLFDHLSLTARRALNGTKMTFACPKCGILVMI